MHLYHSYIIIKIRRLPLIFLIPFLAHYKSFEAAAKHKPKQIFIKKRVIKNNKTDN